MTAETEHPQWEREEAIALCIAAEACAQLHGWHVALSGGLLYKSGSRKDADLVLYRHREGTSTESQPLLLAARYKLLVELKRIGLTEQTDFGRVVKAQYLGHTVDLIFPELDGCYE